MWVSLLMQILCGCVLIIVKSSNGIMLRPTTVSVTENHSVNITCSLNESGSGAVVFDIAGHMSTILIDKCRGEGEIVNEPDRFGFYCPSNDSVIVTLKSVQQSSHLKTMVCRTLVSGSTKTSNTVTIYVMVPITNVTLHYTPTILKTRETRETVIECETSAGYPAPTIHWYKNSSRLLPSQYNIDTIYRSTVTYLMTTKSTLRIYPSREDNSSRLFCTASNTEDNMLYSDNVTMLVYYGPDKPTLSMETYIIHDTVNIISGHSLKIRCNSKGYPVPQYSWLTPNRSLVEGHTLSIPNATYPNNNGTYKCRVNVSMELSTSAEKGANETSVRVIVMYPPMTPHILYNGEFNIPNRSMHIVSGDTFTLRCLSDSVPKPSYTWTGHENNQNITNGNNSSDLKITSIQNDIILTCTAANIMEETNGNQLDKSAYSTLNISVFYPPQKPKFNVTNMVGNVLQHKTNIDVIEGDTVVLICYAHSRPEPDRYFWSTSSSLNNATMELTSVTRNLSGTYLCTAKNTMRRTFGEQINGTNENEIKIEVLYQPTTPWFTYNNSTGPVIKKRIVHVVRGKSLIIFCHSTGNPAATEYKWQSSETNGQMFSIDMVTLDEKLVCRASNVMTDSFAKTINGSSAGTLSVEVLYPPEMIQLSVNHGLAIINNNSVYVVEGRNVTLSCNATSNPPPITYTWTRLSTTLHETITGEYNIVRIKRHQTGQYNCTATNTMMPSFQKEEIGTRSKLININVLYPTSIDSFEVNGHPTVNVTVNETDQLKFVCTVDGKPASNVSILHKGAIIKQQIVTTSISHIITNVSCLQDGLYTCMANNAYTSEVPIQNTTIFVQCSPRPKPNSDMKSVFASKLYTDATISFEVIAYPVPGHTGFVWRRELVNGFTWIKIKNNDRTLISTLDFQSNLTLKNVTRSSFGKYKLEVTNKVGTYTHQFVFKALDVPDTPIDFSYISELSTESTIVLIWKPGFNGGFPQTFVLLYREMDASSIWYDKRIPDNGESTMNTTLTTLKSGTMYEVYIVATNELGNSSDGDILKVQTLAVELPSEPSSVIPIVAGIGCSGVVICLIVTALVFYKRRFHKRKRGGYYRDTQLDRVVYENSVIEAVLEHRHSDTNEQKDKSNVYQNVSVAQFSSTSSVSCEPSTPCTSSVIKQNPPKKLYENLAWLGKNESNAKQKSTTRHKESETCGNKKHEPTEEIRLEHDENEIQNESQNNEFVYSNIGRRIERVQVAELFAYVTGKLYEPEYQEFSKGLQIPTTIELLPENKRINRDQEVYPYDFSSVTVTGDPNCSMNACFIKGYCRNKAYVALSDPTSDTTNGYQTFWETVWHEQSDVIVMLTSLRDISGMKCQQYWPDVGSSITYGDVTVTCLKIRAFGEYTVRTFDVSMAEVVRTLTQLHFTGWPPDTSVPDDVTSLLEFRQRIKATYSVKAGPIIVHCSAGIGRTGTLIALDMLIDEGKTEGSVNVSACVMKLRDQRVNIVQTQEEYAYIHKALIYALVFECEVIYAETFREYLESKPNVFFDNMFEQIRPTVSCHDEDKVIRNNEQYKNINRPGADVPGDKHSVKLYLNKTPEDLDYINAVYMNSFKKKNHFISAQTPRTSSVEDFLSLIYQEDCLCIVSLDVSETHGTVLTDKDVGVYLPQDNNGLSFGNLKVSCSNVETHPQYIVRRLKIENFGKFDRGGNIFYHFQYTQWDSDKSVPNDPSEFAQFARNVDQYVNELGDDEVHVLVHCLDASERSGLFCCIASMIEKIECEGQVNIGNTIRQIRSRRMTVIQNMEQLRFCHQAVNAYINMKTAQ